MVARSQSKPAKSEATPPKTVGGVALPDPNALNKKIQKDYPAELFDDPEYTKKGAELNGSTSTNSTITTTAQDGSTAVVGNSNFTFVLSTPLVIAIVAVVGGLALFPVAHLLLNSKKMLEFKRNSVWSKLTDRFQKPRILESDEFLHQRNIRSTYYDWKSS